MLVIGVACGSLFGADAAWILAGKPLYLQVESSSCAKGLLRRSR